MVPKVDPSKFPEMLNAITENVRDSYAGMVFIDDPEDLASWGFTKEQLNELDSFAQKYGLTDVLEINEWNPDSKPDYILSAFSGLVDKIDDLQGRIRPKADDVSIENFIYLNQIKADVPEPDQFGHAEENDHIFGLISKFAEGQDTAFVVQKVNFSGTKQIGEPEYELLPLGPTSGEDLADFTEWFLDDFKSGIDFGCDENREHLAMLAHTGFYREGEYVDQLLTFHQLDFSNAHAVTEKFSFEGRPESNEFIGDLDQLFHDPNSLVSSSDIIDIIENNRGKMISERDLRLAKAIVDPYIGQDIIATAVLGTKLGSMLNENAYREVVNNAQRLIDGTECIPQGKTLEFILRKRYVETIKADRKSDLSLSKMRGLLKGNRAVARDDCETNNEKTYEER